MCFFSFFYGIKTLAISGVMYRSWPALRDERLRYWHSRSGELMLSMQLLGARRQGYGPSWNMACLEIPWENCGFPWISPCEWVNGLWIYTSIHSHVRFMGKSFYAGIFQRDYLVRVWKKRCNQNWWVDGGRNAIFLWTWILDILASCVMSPLKLKAPDSAKDHITWYNKLEIILAPTQSVFLRRSDTKQG